MLSADQIRVDVVSSATRKATIAWQSGSQEINIEGTTVFKDNGMAATP